ncbi:CGNR zinc finger domain-containing protein [Duganella callida]
MLPPDIAGHPALDLLNTYDTTNDFLRTDEDVIAWLRRKKFLGDAPVPDYAEGTLVNAAIQLREITQAVVRSLLERSVPDVLALNRFLACGTRHLQIICDHSGLRAEDCYDAKTPEQLLARVGQTVADLVIHCEPSAILQCANEGCRLFFYNWSDSGRDRCGWSGCNSRGTV